MSLIFLVFSSSFQNKRSDDIILGGEMSINPGLQDPNVLYAVSVINQHFAKQGDNDLRKAVKIFKATSQVSLV